MPEPRLPRVAPADLLAAAPAVIDTATRDAAERIVAAIRGGGESALRRWAEQFGDVEPGAGLIRDRAELDAAAARLDPDDLALLQRTAARIESFARAQLDTLRPLAIDLPAGGGRAGHDIAAVERAGCYAPGGRYPLPSSVLMTAVTARVAGVGEVWVASPKPGDVTLAAAAVAGADALLAVGGAQAIGALAYGAGPVPACDVIAGPGNRYVTAAKLAVASEVGIDMAAGPSELCVLADGSADPRAVAADLLAQAEHDPDARPLLVTTDAALLDAVDVEVTRQLESLPTAAVAARALHNGAAVLARDLDEAIALCDRLAPEHLQVMVTDAARTAGRLRHYGALFVGPASAEVLGDYGAGPNHVLPTGGAARRCGGLSVFTFLRVRTWMQLDDDDATARLAADARRLAELEGLIGHARAAALRQQR